jgi:hypothetical protein
LRRSRAHALHAACAHHREAGNFTAAWAQHWKSVASPYGLKYLPYTALLLARNRQSGRELLGKFRSARPSDSQSPRGMMAHTPSQD